jgi:hypothetical protein
MPRIKRKIKILWELDEDPHAQERLRQACEMLFSDFPKPTLSAKLLIKQGPLWSEKQLLLKKWQAGARFKKNLSRPL